jgi:hypothetical protein
LVCSFHFVRETYNTQSPDITKGGTLPSPGNDAREPLHNILVLEGCKQAGVENTLLQRQIQLLDFSKIAMESQNKKIYLPEYLGDMGNRVFASKNCMKSLEKATHNDAAEQRD